VRGYHVRVCIVGVDRLGLFGYVDRGRIFGFDEVETAGWNGMTR
jgi:hypothetical protein